MTAVTIKATKGKVEFFNNVAGWGIIKGENGESYFIHHVDIVDLKFFPDNSPNKFRTLQDGQEVLFEVDKNVDKKHPAARNLVIA
jgi:cold shock CspA family protein